METTTKEEETVNLTIATAVCNFVTTLLKRGEWDDELILRTYIKPSEIDALKEILDENR